MTKPKEETETVEVVEATETVETVGEPVVGLASPTMLNAGALYPVVYGDTVKSIAAQVGCTVKELRDLNNFGGKAEVEPGMLFRVPSSIA